MITNFDHVHFYTADLQGTLEFYERVMGAEAIGAIPNSHGGKNHILLLGGQFIAISHYPPGLEPHEAPEHGDGALRHGFGVAHLGINVRKLEVLITKLKDAGIEVHSAPRGAGALRYVYFTAPDGVVIELTEYNLPAKLRPVVAALDAFNKGVHLARRGIGKALIKRAAGA